ncbi:MAG: hypothetical protein UY21_C0001G0077 [Microgenomates group bacterium GW2011_GWA1_48_10]|nr:MAG: hypothetical protein UY21_C0001G0077 [Microgenomates group bacterium GW2011_GWA1_48_10]
MAEKFFSKIKYHSPLLVVLALGAVLRWINLLQSMQFFYDQARDALVATGIMRGDFVLVGPSADTSGLFMGPLWYYFLTPLYFLAQGNPAIVLWLTSFLDLATIILLYSVAKLVFDRKTALIAAAIWSFGALPVAYARTLSNPASTALWSLLIFIGLVKIGQNDRSGSLIVALSLALLYQLNPASAYLLTFWVGVSLIFLRRHLTNRRWLALCLILFLLSFSPQLLFEIRNHYPSLEHLRNLFLAAGPTEGFFYGLYLRWTNFLGELTNYLFYGQPVWSLVALLGGAALFVRGSARYRLLLGLWLTLPLFSYFFLYFRGESHPHYLLGWIPAAVLIFAYLISRLSRVFPPVALAIFVFFIFSATFGWGKEIILKQHIAQPADPNTVGLADQIGVVDYIYQDAAGEPFGYHNYGIVPYWEDAEWQYLFSWYGQKKYGYLPSRRAGNPLYLIYEPDPYLPEFQKRWLTEFRSPDKGPVIGRKEFPVYTVEKFDKRGYGH